MSTEAKSRGKGRWVFPLLIALPFLAVITLILIRYGTSLLNMINVLIKTVVTS